METRGCLCLAARRAAREITRRFDHALRPHGLRSTQFSALAVLTLAGPKTVNELAGILSASRTTMTRNLAVLKERKLAVAQAGEDARERIISVTEQGQAAILAAYPDWRRVQTELTAGMGEKAADGLRALAWQQLAQEQN